MAQNLQVCTVSDDLADTLKKFKFRKEKNVAAIIMKIRSEEQDVIVEEEIEDLDFDELENMLPQSQPRYVLISYVHKKDDGRVTYPLCFIFVSPEGCPPTLSMMYSGTHDAVVQVAKVTKVYKVRSADELTEDFIKAQL